MKIYSYDPGALLFAIGESFENKGGVWKYFEMNLELF